MSPSPPPDKIAQRPAAAVDRPPAARPQGVPTTLPTRTRSGSQRQGFQLSQSNDHDDLEEPRVSHVRILPTSLPYVHDQLMEQRERDREERAQAADRLLEERAQARAKEGDDPSQAGHDWRSREEQEATARALKPHSRSIVDLEKLRLEPPETRSAPHQPRRTRKWQFGIRSRNQPYEAMLYLYRAIAAQGGIWDIVPDESGL